MAARPHDEYENKLAMAMVHAAHTPLLLLDGDLVVVAASESFCSAFQIDPARTSGIALGSLGEGEWKSARLRSLLEATAFDGARIDAYEMDYQLGSALPRCLILNARKLLFGNDSDNDDSDVRLLVSINDVTEFKASDRMKDELLRQKAVLMQELQHRVANSLQIIASVLMQSARKVQSEETRVHLAAAHGRVLAVGDVQKQLATSELGRVEIAPYLTRLCDSLAASMIHDPEKLSIHVQADKAMVDADISISIGLIVTELVINSLKHAFPDGQKGRIDVAYSVRGSSWTLTVSDDGVGMPQGEPAEAGLGTSIVRALAEQLGGIIHVVDARPGTSVSVAHLKLSVIDGVVKPRPVGNAV